MGVRLQLKGPLKKYTGTGEETVEVKPEQLPCTAAKLLQELGVPASAISFITVNEEKKGLDTALNGGESIVVYPRVAGG